MNNDIQALYERRKQDYITTANIMEPEYVPVVNQTYSFAIGLMGVTVKQAMEDQSLFVKSNEEFFGKYYCDCVYSVGINNPNILALQALGCDAYVYSPEGYTLQHLQTPTMELEDYDKLIADPDDYVYNVHAPKKMAKLRAGKEEAKQAMINAMKELDKFNGSIAQSTKIIGEKYGVVPLKGGPNLSSPFDMIFDSFRGFRNSLIDLRRCPDKVLATIEALNPWQEKPLQNLKSSFPYARSVPHAPTFLGYKNFEKFYFPHYKANIETMYKQGSKTLIVLEGTWGDFFDLMYDGLPKGSTICLLENDDIFEFKKKYGDKVTLGGGCKLYSLKYHAESECIDYAKKVIDECAPGGGFVFTIDKNVMTPDDVNVSTYAAVHQFAHEYGKYGK